MSTRPPSVASRVGAGRWPLRLVLLVIALTQVLGCQLVLAPVAAAPSAVLSSHGSGHDITCEPLETVAVAAPVAKSQARDCADTQVPVLFALLLPVARLAPFRRDAAHDRRRTRSSAGRHLLLALGISRT